MSQLRKIESVFLRHFQRGQLQETRTVSLVLYFRFFGGLHMLVAAFCFSMGASLRGYPVAGQDRRMEYYSLL